MTETLRPASRQTAFNNARALCQEITADMIYPSFDIAMDMARHLDRFFQTARVRSPSEPTGQA